MEKAFVSTASMQKAVFQMADLGEESRLPDFHNVSYVHSSVVWDASLKEEDVRYMRYGRVASILPYLDRNAYDRERKETVRETAVLENEHVRAVFLPWMGGRLWSLTVDGKEVLSHNPVVQPCNLALRNAWCSGGVEWNVSVRGHNMLTCETLFTELIHMEDGTACIRMYEFERLRGIVYRLEAYLPAQSRFLYVQVHIENPTGNGTVPMYWWSNMAVPEEEGMRVVAPAETAILSLYEAGNYQMQRVSLPFLHGMDLSRPVEIPRSLDVFYDIADRERPFIAALGKDHTGLFQCSTAREYGRKLFVWGMGQGGRHWQAFLSDGRQKYVEIQAGIARTQQDHIPMEDGETWEWLEVYGQLTCDVENLDYSAAVRACREALDAQISEKMLREEWEGRGRDIAAASGVITVMGSGWGALENEMRAMSGMEKVSRVCRFPQESIGEKQKPWQELLLRGRLGTESLQSFPDAYMMGSRWQERLEAAPQTAPVLYHRGVMAQALGQREKARQYLEESLKKEESACAYRALARLDVLDDRQEDCLQHYRSALSLAEGMIELKQEYLQTLLVFGMAQEALDCLMTLAPSVQSIPRFQYLRAQALVETGQYQEAEQILLQPLVIPDMREGELSLCDLWFRLYMKKDGTSLAQTMRNHPLPWALDFRMHE
ncbi:MAG: DUF5107 domain-containing protein [Clostridia bacterium]|nr:DUF5107 domain-containing protein [Clostridia bacterium]